MLSSFRKVFVLLDAFTAEAPEWSLADLSRSVGMPKPTVHHIMMTLIEGGWIDRNPGTKKFRLGARLWEKGCLAIKHIGVRGVARPFVEALVEDCGETVRLGILDSADPRWVIYVDCVESRHAVRADSNGAVRAPSYSVATGKAMLAHNPEVAKKLLARPLRGYTPDTLTEPAALLKDLALTRERGYSLNQNEFRTDVVGIAAPIRDEAGRAIAAIGISGPAYRLGPAVVRRLAPAVVRTAMEISRRMGFVNQQGEPDEAVTPSHRRRVPVAAGVRRGGAGISGAPDRGVRGLRARGRQ